MYSQKVSLGAGAIDVRDAYEMLKLFTSRQKIDISDDYDAWARLLVDEMKGDISALNKYDTVLIDEAQDMKQWAFEMIELHGKPGATICLGAGAGQELYGEESEWLREFSKSAKTRGLRRVFRNTKSVFQL